MESDAYDSLIDDFFRALDRVDLRKVEDLLRNGANPNGMHPIGRPPLHCAAARGNVRLVQILLDAGAKKSLKDRWGCTAAEYIKNMSGGHESEGLKALYKPVLETLER